MDLSTLQPNAFQVAMNNYFPLLANYRFGSPVIANLGGSDARLSWTNTTEQNQRVAQFDPVRLTFPSLMNVDDPPPVPEPLPPAYPRGFERDTTKVQPGLDYGAGENRLLHLFKLQFVALLALVLLAIGLYLLSQQTEFGQKVQGKVGEALEVAAIV